MAGNKETSATVAKNNEKEERNCLGALAIFPIEIWESVLERVDSPRDVRNFCKAWEFPDWDAILHRTKASWLFDEVFPLVFPFLSTKKQVLTCRLVCKRWCKAVDHFLESNPCRRPAQPSSTGPNSDMRLGPLTKSLREKGLLYNSIQSLDKNSNRIVGRSAHFSSSPETDLTEFLIPAGGHIWDFRVEIRENSPLELFSRLMVYLTLVPNLKRLELSGETTLVIEETVQENIRQLRNANLSLPELPELETIDATVFGQYRDEIMEILLSAYSSSLRRLTLYCYTIPINNTSIKLESLTELSISIDDDKQMESLSHLNLPHLRRLNIFILRNSNRGRYPNFLKIFHTINTSFSRSLRALLVEFPVTYSPIQWSQQGVLPTFHLPNLKTLELKEAPFHSFNFLAHLTSLEYLHLYRYRWGHHIGMGHHYQENETSGPEVNEILDMKQLLDNPSASSDAWYQSNVWKVLPRLKVFTLSKASNSRAPAANAERCYRRPAAL